MIETQLTIQIPMIKTFAGKFRKNKINIQSKELHSLLMASAALRAPPFELRHRAATPEAEEQHRAAIGRRHLPQLRAEALVVRVIVAAAFPRERIHIPHRLIHVADPQQVLPLQQQIELHPLLQPPAAGAAAQPRAVAAADLEEADEGEEGDGE